MRYELKTSYSDGTTHVLFEPLDFIARLAALLPKPRANLTRYHGVSEYGSVLRQMAGFGRSEPFEAAEIPVNE